MESFSSLTAYLDRITKEFDPGSDTVIRVGHREVYRYRPGYADVESKTPIKGDELYLMWSVSKVVTCAAFMTLVEKGVVRLDDPVAKYRPAFAEARCPDSPPVGDGMTVFNLATMTSGLTYDTDYPELLELKRRIGAPCPTVETAALIARQPLAFEPGTAWRYGLSHDVLAAVCEVAAGERFADYAKRVIFDPLGMKDSTYRPVAEKDKCRIATQYRWDEEKGGLVRTHNSCALVFGPEYDSGGAGLVCSVDDLAVFADALACGGTAENGVSIMKPETVDMWRENRIGTMILKYFDYLAGYGYGLGVRTMTFPEKVDGYAVRGEFGWDGAAGSVVIIDPKNRVSLVSARHLLESPGHTLESLRQYMYEGLVEEGIVSFSN